MGVFCGCNISQERKALSMVHTLTLPIIQDDQFEKELYGTKLQGTPMRQATTEPACNHAERSARLAPDRVTRRANGMLERNKTGGRRTAEKDTLAFYVYTPDDCNEYRAEHP